MKHRLKHIPRLTPPPIQPDGFTLLEMILALLITAILASIAGMGLVSAMGSYAVVKENVRLSQKIQLATGRIHRELLELTAIADRDATRPYLVYESATGQRRAIARIDDTIRLYEAPAMPVTDTYLENNGDLLVDQVAGFTLNYFQGSGSWSGADIRELSTIQFTIDLQRRETAGNPVSVNALVYLRNNDNLGGKAANLPVAPPTLTNYACFIDCLNHGTAELFPALGQRAGLARFALGAMLLLAAAGVWDAVHHPSTAIRLMGLIQYGTGPGVASRIGCRKTRRSPPGSALIGVIMAIMVFAALGAAIVPLIGSSQFQQSVVNRSAQAYYMAESGMRHAASLYLNAADDAARYAALDAMHDVTHRLSVDPYAFTLAVNPYYFHVDLDPGGTTTLVTRFYGELADGFSFPATGGYLSVDDTIHAFSSAVRSGSQVTFSLAAALTADADTPVYPVARALGGQTVSDGGDLSLEPGSGSMFPARNGSFVLGTETYTYQAYQPSSFVLTSIRRTDGSAFADFSLAADESIRLKQFVKVTSTGVAGSGDMAVSRDIVYHVQIPEENQLVRASLHETFDNLDRWDASAAGAHAIETLDGTNRVLRVTAISQSGVDAPSISLISLNTSAVQFDSDRFDAQVKIGFLETATPPVHGYDPVPVPTYYSAGLCFRLFGNANTYGLSFQRGSSAASPPDNIENDLIPVNDALTIVLWQATSDGADKRWLAYKRIDDMVILSEDVESGASGWTTVGDASGNDLWHIDTHPPGYAAGSRAWYYGNGGATRNYNTGNANAGMLVSPPIDLCDFQRVRLRFSSWYDTEPNPIYANLLDFKYVDVSADNGATWDTPPARQILYPGVPMRSWQEIEVPLSDYAGQTILIRFRFDTVDDQYNDYEGWYVDNIRIVGDYPLMQSTLLARFVQSASIAFDSGGPVAMDVGDTFVGVVSGSSATVRSEPLVSGGDWLSSDAAGTLLLDHVSGTFQIGERLTVAGKGELATITAFRAVDHYVQSYVGTAAGCGTPNTDPLDGHKHPHPIDPMDVNWPPDEGDPWTADRDHFQLIQWDAVNPAVSTVALIASIDRPDTVVRSSESALMADGSTLGLHTFGKGSLNVYFDDFAYQSVVDQPIAVSQPIQY